MSNQLFSSENFQYILDKENYKGIYLERTYFPDVEVISQQISEIKFKKKQYLQLPKNDHGRHLSIKHANQRKQYFLLKKQDLLEKHLNQISERISKNIINLELTSSIIKNNPVYTFANIQDPALFFLSKQINNNLKHTCHLKPSDRNVIIPQLKTLLSNNFPKIILKADIKKFFESINRQLLLEKLYSEPQLSILTKNYIKQILKEFGKQSKTSSSHIGIPRGLSISSYLAELYMKRFDDFFKHHPHCSYYARYVDDIIIIFHPPIFNDPSYNYMDLLQNELARLHLQFNTDKTKICSIQDITPALPYNFEFLGYDFLLTKPSSSIILNLDISTKKYQRYLKKLEVCFANYHRNKQKYPTKSIRLLHDRIKFLVNSFHLKNNKNNVLTGLYFSNKFINPQTTSQSKLQLLDQELQKWINQSNIPTIAVKNITALTFSFDQAFQTRQYINLPNKKRLAELTVIWNNI